VHLLCGQLHDCALGRLHALEQFREGSKHGAYLLKLLDGFIGLLNLKPCRVHH
jgi:hypothetical protein